MVHMNTCDTPVNNDAPVDNRITITWDKDTPVNNRGVPDVGSESRSGSSGYISIREHEI